MVKDSLRIACKPQFIVGLHQSGPISSAALLKDGKLLAAAPEERFSRKKHDRSFPHRALQFCLDQAGIGLNDVDICAVGWNPGENASLKYRAGYSDWMRYPGEWLSSVPNHLLPLLGTGVSGTESGFITGENRTFTIRFVDHHASHARIAYDLSGYEKCAILITDGWSEQKVTSWMCADDGKIDVIKTIRFPNSLGCFYAAMTEFLGYKSFSDEWKIMGMAAYGDPQKYPQISGLVKILPRGEYELDLSYFDFYNFDRSSFFSPKLEALLGPSRKSTGELTSRHFDIAAATQRLFEEVMDNLLSHLRSETGCDNLVIGGGVALNCLYNGQILDRTGFSRCFVSFAPDDSGNSIGAAFHACSESGRKMCSAGQLSAVGIEFSEDQIGESLEMYKLNHRMLPDIARETAKLLAEEKVVGWFQGKAEFGQRALGHRSIFASPRRAEMKERINSAVKFRESFRPFAPMLRYDDMEKMFETSDREPVPFMEKAFRFRKEAAEMAPAVVHRDGTGRLQTVRKESEPLLYELISEFADLTGCPVLLNTSFNLNGEPIINTPEDAIRTFVCSGMDALVIGSRLLEKREILGFRV